MIEEGSWVDARIERADPDRKPIPKVDLRSMLRPLGPVAVFCASNFPLAFSVAGGDTASALAAGCPVVVIAHSSHPGVAEIVAAAVIRAAQTTGMPEGVFSVLYGGGRKVGQAVVKHPVTQAVGFTGSRAGGTALMDTAAKPPAADPRLRGNEFGQPGRHPARRARSRRGSAGGRPSSDRSPSASASSAPIPASSSCPKEKATRF